MNDKLLRQIKDIQFQAGRLTHGSPSSEDLATFNDYNEELKTYLLSNCEEKEITDLVHQIPEIEDVDLPNDKATGVILIILAIVTIGTYFVYASYLYQMRQNKLMQNNVQTAQGKYASIEFLLKALH